MGFDWLSVQNDWFPTEFPPCNFTRLAKEKFEDRLRDHRKVRDRVRFTFTADTLQNKPRPLPTRRTSLTAASPYDHLHEMHTCQLLCSAVQCHDHSFFLTASAHSGNDIFPKTDRNEAKVESDRASSPRRKATLFDRSAINGYLLSRGLQSKTKHSKQDEPAVSLTSFRNSNCELSLFDSRKVRETKC